MSNRCKPILPFLSLPPLLCQLFQLLVMIYRERGSSRNTAGET